MLVKWIDTDSNSNLHWSKINVESNVNIKVDTNLRVNYLSPFLTQRAY